MVLTQGKASGSVQCEVGVEPHRFYFGCLFHAQLMHATLLETLGAPPVEPRWSRHRGNREPPGVVVGTELGLPRARLGGTDGTGGTGGTGGFKVTNEQQMGSQASLKMEKAPDWKGGAEHESGK